MMFRWPIVGATLLALSSLHSSLHAQVPAIPGVPAGAAGAAGATGAAPAAPAAPSNLWSFLCPTPAQCQACMQKICACPLVQFFGGALTPMSAVSGGLFPSCCPGPLSANPADLQKPADGALGAAARIKAKEAEAKARRAAVRYLGTVDCRRYPEAEAALVNALRGDENECVRYEAALAFANGCCCTRRVLEALVITVSGRKTNDPAETSPRVKMAAAVALQRCLKSYCEVEPLTPGKPPEAAKPAAQARLAPDPLVEDGKQVLAAYKEQVTGTAALVKQAAATIEPPAAPPVVQVAQMAAPAPPLVLADVEPAARSELPPTGQRDLWSVLRHTIRGR